MPEIRKTPSNEAPQSGINRDKQKKEQKDIPVPWEFRIHKFKAVTVPTKTIPEKYNFWNIDGVELETGFHGEKETNTTTLGQLLPVSEGKYILTTDAAMSPQTLDELLPAVLEDMKKEGVEIIQVIRETEEEPMDLAA